MNKIIPEITIACTDQAILFKNQFLLRIEQIQSFEQHCLIHSGKSHLLPWKHREKQKFSLKPDWFFCEQQKHRNKSHHTAEILSLPPECKNKTYRNRLVSLFQHFLLKTQWDLGDNSLSDTNKGCSLFVLFLCYIGFNIIYSLKNIF